METGGRVKILCVDDEPNVLEALSLHLRRRFEVATATSGAAALELLARDGTTAVVLSDMRMPAMDGAAFLRRARDVAPDAVRMLLTGQADLDSAIAVVNEGRIFRFLTKPCPPPALLAAVDAAAEQHRLLISERVLLEQTLHGSIKALTDVLALTNPVSFGRATRIKRHVSELAARLDVQPRWPVEVAAMLSQLGCITLPSETVERVYFAQALSEPEQKMVARVPIVTEQLLANIPRLEVVREILANYVRPPRQMSSALSEADKAIVFRGAQLLRIAVDFDSLEAQAHDGRLAIETMRGRADRYDPEQIDALAALRGNGDARQLVREVSLSAMTVGMVFAADVKLSSGTLLVARGYEVTPGFLERIRNFRPGSIAEPLRVVLPAPKVPA